MRRHLLLLGLTLSCCNGDAAALLGQSTNDADPFQLMRQRAVEALDESYDSWNFRPEETVDSTSFTINYIASLSTDGRRRLDRVMILHVDPNRDRMVTREEAIRFLEIQLGLRWVTDDRLRLDDGRLVNFAGFLRADGDQNDEISEQEFAVADWTPVGAKADFALLDTNGDRSITLAEFAAPDGPHVLDPTLWFRDADRNADGCLDELELVEATPMHRLRLIRSNLAAFDEDGDQRLSSSEFRLSMLGNFNYPWEVLPLDEDRDAALSFEEFNFHPQDLFQLQKRYFYHRLDRNGDDRLTIDEFEFAQEKSYTLIRISVGGEELIEIYRDDRFPTLGSPSVSADGESVLCHAIPPQGEHKSLIVYVSADGGETREVCSGLMPSWAPSRSQFACSRYEQGAGVWIMGTDGNPQQRIDDGWGARWSPDGKSIAYTNDNSIRIYDVATRASRMALSKHDHPYRHILPHLAWSPDSRRIAFQGQLDRQVEISVLPITSPSELQRRYSTLQPLGNEMTWIRNGSGLLFSMHSSRYSRNLIHQLDLDTDAPPAIFHDSGTGTSWNDVCASPDGSYIVATASR